MVVVTQKLARCEGGRFAGIRWACLTFLICMSASLTKTANLELKERRPSSQIIGDKATERRTCKLFISKPGVFPWLVHGRVPAPILPHACGYVYLNEANKTFLDLFTFPLVDLSFPVGESAVFSPSLSVLFPLRCCMWFPFSSCPVSQRFMQSQTSSQFQLP